MYDFEFIDSVATKNCLLNGSWAITELNLWEWLCNFEVSKKEGFMFSGDNHLGVINTKMESPNAPIRIAHSGCSFALTMRELQYIAKNGYDNYKILVLNNK